MYLEHYGLKEPPFSITPDPRFVFLSERHRDALAHLLFGIDKGGGGGFVQLTGEVGTGKTTLCRLLLEQLPEHARVALVLNPRLSAVELLQTICEELHCDLTPLQDSGRRDSIKALVDTLNAYLLGAYAQGLRVVLIIDEAQTLSIDALEQVRLLTNLETDTQKLLQVILLGQPELRDMLARPDLRQLAQRITARFHLTPLSAAETEAYLRHRYAIAGGLHFPFTRAAAQRIHAHSGGVPRLTNVIAERALLAGYAHDQTTLDRRTVDRAAREALPPARRGRASRARLTWAAAAAVTIAVLAAWWWPQSTRAPIAPATAKATTPAPVTAKPVAAKPAVHPRLDAATLAQRLAAGDDPAASRLRLLHLWQAPASLAPTALAACAPELAPGLYCLRGQGNLDALAALGRPVLLRLDSGGKQAWALLLGADAVHARLQFGDASYDVGRLLLAGHWHGEYVALFRAPAGFSSPLAATAPAPLLDWVRDATAGTVRHSRCPIRRWSRPCVPSSTRTGWRPTAWSARKP